jgi:hypothetical protein
MSKSKRDYNIDKSYRKEIDLRTKSVPSKRAYTRKTKHKGQSCKH